MRSIVEPIVAGAAGRADRPAVVCGDRTVSHGRLVAAALGFARVLDESAASPRVAVEARRTPETVAAILGILCAGRSYVPLNPADPPARQRRIVGCAGASHVVARAPLALPGTAALPPPSLDATDPAKAADLVVPAPESEAYVLFTSGSTGGPKGVPLSHRNACAFSDWAAQAFDVGPADRVGAVSPLFFDLSTFDLFVGLGAGATVLLLPDEVVKFPRAAAEALRDATVLYAVPSALRALVAAAGPGAFERLRLLLLAGEPFPVADLDAIRRAAPRARLHNLYGPVETNVVSSFAVPEAWPAGEPVPIGRAAAGATLAILTKDGRALRGPGGAGEIVVSGPSVFAGYLAADPVPPDPFVELDGERWYRTGDLGTIGEDGLLWYRGRLDDRVKCRGFLVELAEVEAVLARTPGVAAAAAVAVGQDTPEAAVHGFVVPAGADGASPRDVLAWCAEQLPRYMWPARVHVVDGLPLGRTGKLDRGVLAERVAS